MKFLFLFGLLSLDILSKIGALSWVAPMHSGSYPFGGIGILQNIFGISFSLNTVFNTGAAWGIFSGYPLLLFLFRVLMIGGLVFFLCFEKKKAKNFPLWLIATGAIGNAIDYLLYGHVVDFFHFVFWGVSFPVFNCADAYISIGVAWLFLFESCKKKALSS